MNNTININNAFSLFIDLEKHTRSQIESCQDQKNLLNILDQFKQDCEKFKQALGKGSDKTIIGRLDRIENKCKGIFDKINRREKQIIQKQTEKNILPKPIATQQQIPSPPPMPTNPKSEALVDLSQFTTSSLQKPGSPPLPPRSPNSKPPASAQPEVRNNSSSKPDFLSDIKKGVKLKKVEKQESPPVAVKTAHGFSAADVLKQRTNLKGKEKQKPLKPIPAKEKTVLDDIVAGPRLKKAPATIVKGLSVKEFYNTEKKS